MDVAIRQVSSWQGRTNRVCISRWQGGAAAVLDAMVASESVTIMDLLAGCERGVRAASRKGVMGVVNKDRGDHAVSIGAKG